MTPRHVAIIMDGNGRWAKQRGYPRFYGHIRGVKRVKEIVKAARAQGVRVLTLYAFSTENWKRPESELAVLWKLLKKYVESETAELKKNGIRLKVMGELERLPASAKSSLFGAIDVLKNENEMVLNFALSYGSRREIILAVQKMLDSDVKQVSEESFEHYLNTADLGPDSNVDLMIRTSGEKRLSNFMLWQNSYAEFEFPEVLWPDYSVAHFEASLENFAKRNRRFGAV